MGRILPKSYRYGFGQSLAVTGLNLGRRIDVGDLGKLVVICPFRSSHKTKAIGSDHEPFASARILAFSQQIKEPVFELVADVLKLFAGELCLEHDQEGIVIVSGNIVDPALLVGSSLLFVLIPERREYALG